MDGHLTQGELADELRSHVQRFPEKRPTRWVTFPRCIALGSADPPEHRVCIACDVLGLLGKRRVPDFGVTDEHRSQLARGRGIPLKTLLTV